ncbi:hypothetical protein ACQCVP_10625 [Rossellomorea vietnamensis]|uniref:hypothetical protein n=1 Tax=Rossellomorea vietnamensis TaxID=218284 RepID=UPI003CEC2A71
METRERELGRRCVSSGGGWVHERGSLAGDMYPAESGEYMREEVWQKICIQRWRVETREREFGGRYVSSGGGWIHERGSLAEDMYPALAGGYTGEGV